MSTTLKYYPETSIFKKTYPAAVKFYLDKEKA